MVVGPGLCQTMWVYAIAAAALRAALGSLTLASRSLAATPAVLCNRARSSSLALDRLSLAMEGTLALDGSFVGTRSGDAVGDAGVSGRALGAGELGLEDVDDEGWDERDRKSEKGREGGGVAMVG